MRPQAYAPTEDLATAFEWADKHCHVLFRLSLVLAGFSEAPVKLYVTLQVFVATFILAADQIVGRMLVIVGY